MNDYNAKVPVSGWIDLKPFKAWCLQILPTIFDESMSYYELLCKVVQLLNDTMADVDLLHDSYNEFTDNITGEWNTYKTQLTQEWENLKNYVDNYFDSLDVQEEINQKLDEMVRNGTLSQLINPLITTQVNRWLSDNIHQDTGIGLDPSLTLNNMGAPAKTVGDILNNVYMNNTQQIGSGSGSYSGNITKFGDLNPHKAYFIWKNAFSSFTDVNLDIELRYSYIYVYPSIWVSPSWKTYSSMSLISKVLLITSDNSLVLGAWDSSTKILTIKYSMKVDNTLRLRGYPADAKQTGFKYGPYDIEIGSPSGDYSGSITSIGQLDPHKSYFIWNNALKTFKDFKNPFNIYVPYIYLKPAFWVGNVYSYSASKYQIPVLLTLSWSNLCFACWNSSTKTLEIQSILTPDSTLKINNQNANSSSVTQAINDSKVLISPDGTRWLTRVTNAGVLITYPIIPKKAVFIGNSLLLGWGSFGMAASDNQHDYFYYLQQQVPEMTYQKSTAGDFEGATTKEIALNWVDNTLLPMLSADTDFLMIQLGDNCDTTAKKNSVIQAIPEMFTKIRDISEKIRIVWCGLWYQRSWVTELSNTVTSNGGEFVDFSKIQGTSAVGNIVTYPSNITMNYNDVTGVSVEDSKLNVTLLINGTSYTRSIDYETYSKNGTNLTVTGPQRIITNSGMASHPGDTAFKKIAELMINKLQW